MFSAHPLPGPLLILYNEDADLALICLMKRVWAKLSNTIHCTHGQQFVLHCAADYHSGKDIPLLLKFLQNLKSTKNSKAKISASLSFCCCCIEGAHPGAKDILCQCKNDGNAVARSILLVSKIVRIEN